MIEVLASKMKGWEIIATDEVCHLLLIRFFHAHLTNALVVPQATRRVQCVSSTPTCKFKVRCAPCKLSTHRSAVLIWHLLS